MQRFLYLSLCDKGNNFQRITMPFYAVANGRTVGTFQTWSECESQVKGYTGAVYKKFNTLTEAQSFITSKSNGNTSTNAVNYSKSNKNPSVSSYFMPKPKVTSPKKFHKSDESQIEQLEKEVLAFNELTQEDEELAQLDLSRIQSTSFNKTSSTQKQFKRKYDFPSKSIKKIKIDEKLNNKLYGNTSFREDSKGFVHVFTDGSCIDNGKKTARAGLGVYFDDGHPLNTAQAVSGRATNNCGEIQAASMAIKLAKQSNIKKLCINTDSEFLIKSVESWMAGWKRRKWTLANGTPVKNKTDFQELDNALSSSGIEVQWNHVSAHIGIHGNECADVLAKEGSDMYHQKHSKSN